MSVVLLPLSVSLRFAFVNFDNFESAHNAVDELHGQDLRTDEEKVHLDD